jgi:hypothetical protein
MLGHRANRVVDCPETSKTIVLSDAQKAFDEMADSRKPKVSKGELVSGIIFYSTLFR